MASLSPVKAIPGALVIHEPDFQPWQMMVGRERVALDTYTWTVFSWFM